MLPITKKLQLIIIGFACAIISVLLINIIFIGFPEILALAKSLDYHFYKKFFNPSLTPYKKLVIIDSNDHIEGRSRSEYAKMICQLDTAGAKCIAIDIRFLAKAKYDSAGNEKLVNSVRKCHKVILSVDFATEHPSSAVMVSKVKRLALPDSICQKFIPKIVATKEVGLPFDSLLSVTRHIGHINSVHKEYYHFPPVMTFEEKCYSSLPLEIARYCSGEGNYLFEPTEIPVDADGQLLVNFIREEKFRPYFHLWEDAMDLLQNQDDSFNDAVVLIVNASVETKIPTLIGEYSHWAILASVTSQLLQHSYIEASIIFGPACFSIFLVFIGLTWLLFLAPRFKKKWRKTRIIFITGNVLMLFLVYISLIFFKEWLGVIIPMFALNTSLIVIRARFYAMIKPPQFIDFGLAVLERQGQIYPIQVVESSIGEEEGNAAFESFLEEKSFQETLLRLKDLQASRKDIKWMGEKLFDALFQGEVFQIIKNNLAKVVREKEYLRIKLRIDAPELVCLPWELMHSSKLPPGFIVLHKRLSMTRYLPLSQPIKKSHFRMPLKVLVVVSSPSDLTPLDIKGEIKLIKQSLRPLIWGGDIRLKLCNKPTLENLCIELEHEPDVVHYIGHGHFDIKTNETFLYFETEANSPDPVDGETLGNLLHESAVKLVVINSCEGATSSATDAFTGVAQNLIKVGVPAVLAMQFKIPDRTALWFSKVFYSTFITNQSIDFAVAEARRYIMTKTGLCQQDWAIPVLFMRAHEGKIFDYEL